MNNNEKKHFLISYNSKKKKTEFQGKEWKAGLLFLRIDDYFH